MMSDCTLKMRDLHSSTWYIAHIVSVRLRQLHFDFITLSTRFVDYLPWITQSIKGINK